MKPSDKGRLDLTLIACACALLMVLPLVTTLDDFLTGWALQLGANNPLQAIVPTELESPVDDETLSFDVAKISKPLAKGLRRACIGRIKVHQDPNA